MTTFSEFSSQTAFYGVTKDPAPTKDQNNTDIIAPDFRLYIEGVQVPFEAMTVNQVYNSLPTADIQVPPESGLLDITRGYEPKVHIFYKDDNYGGFRLLFWGHIKSNSYSRSRSSGSTSISFHCEHKNSFLSQVTLDYAGWATPGVESESNPNSRGAIAKADSMNSTAMVIEALRGVDGTALLIESISPKNDAVRDAPTNKLDPSLAKFEPRLIGMPGVAVNLWNQLRKTAFVNSLTNINLSSMYVPLIDEGLSFFKRLGGHPVLEEKLQATKMPYCHTANEGEKDILIPPSSRVSMISAVQRELTVKNINSIASFSGELTSYQDILATFMEHCKYDINTLASPAEVNVDPEVYIDNVNAEGVTKVVIETILKPQIPFYYSPACNVLLPRMYSSLQISQNEGSTPTRISALHDAMPGDSNSSSKVSFNAPHSIREAIAYNNVLKTGGNFTDLSIASTLGYAYSIPGKYEQGVGIRPTRMSLPWWLTILVSDKELEGKAGNVEERPAKGSDDYNDMMILTSEWRNRYSNKVKYEDGSVETLYDPSKNNLNQNDPLNPIKPYQRIMFSTLDYEFSEKNAGSRSGFIEAVFNPYIVPGYPMDVIDDSPNHPSFHGYCTSVSHSITSRSVSTSISMVSVTTYAELSNFYTPSLHPYLQTALNMVNGDINEDLYSANTDPAVKGDHNYGDTAPFTNTASTILQNPTAKATADVFYKQVLGVGAVAPDDMIHFATGRAFPLFRNNGVLVPRVVAGSAPDIKPHGHVARETDDYYSVVGNLRLVSRPIESRESIAEKFKYNFIDIDRNLYNNSFINYVNPLLASNLLLEPGASLFLDYMETADFINAVKVRLNIS